ncbi:hypothetical protein GALMADRAFT_229151 [Galerina marginata CBS 339.88]|uniref:Uncharacterized protein n=1 Tax=Galerina marginata (strain CBS 339.88) TaxID=685588 RepID=A0A067SQS5_GALM3|nr:hypothetical protein GALMADRAFT_229151 [Galerina marginata CBS 339.88]
MRTDPNTVFYLNALATRTRDSSWVPKQAVRGVIFGSDCKHAMAITALPRPGVDELETVDDLDLDKWLSAPFLLNSGIWADCLDDRTLEIDRFPFDSKHTLPVVYTVVWSHKRDFNFCVASHSSYKIRWEGGNIVVIKRKPAPAVHLLDIEEADMNLVCAMVLSAIERKLMVI